jgi:hypothetical protein
MEEFTGLLSTMFFVLMSFFDFNSLLVFSNLFILIVFLLSITKGIILDLNSFLPVI